MSLNPKVSYPVVVSRSRDDLIIYENQIKRNSWKKWNCFWNFPLFPSKVAKRVDTFCLWVKEAEKMFFFPFSNRYYYACGNKFIRPFIYSRSAFFVLAFTAFFIFLNFWTHRCLNGLTKSQIIIISSVKHLLATERKQSIGCN